MEINCSLYYSFFYLSIFRLLNIGFYAFGVQSVEGDSRDNSWNPTHIGDGAAKQNEGNSGATSSSEGSGHVTRLASIDSFDSKWYSLHPCFAFSITCFTCKT